MKILVVADGVATRQWLGRIFNQTGLYFDHTSLYEIRFVTRIADCEPLIQESKDGQCVVVVWSHATPVETLVRLSEVIPVAVIPCSDSARRSLANSQCHLIDEEDLDAPHLLEWIEAKTTANVPLHREEISAMP